MRMVCRSTNNIAIPDPEGMYMPCSIRRFFSERLHTTGLMHAPPATHRLHSEDSDVRRAHILLKLASIAEASHSESKRRSLQSTPDGTLRSTCSAFSTGTVLGENTEIGEVTETGMPPAPTACPWASESGMEDRAASIAPMCAGMRRSASAPGTPNSWLAAPGWELAMQSNVFLPTAPLTASRSRDLVRNAGHARRSMSGTMLATNPDPHAETPQSASFKATTGAAGMKARGWQASDSSDVSDSSSSAAAASYTSHRGSTSSNLYAWPDPGDALHIAPPAADTLAVGSAGGTVVLRASRRRLSAHPISFQSTNPSRAQPATQSPGMTASTTGSSSFSSAAKIRPPQDAAASQPVLVTHRNDDAPPVHVPSSKTTGGTVNRRDTAAMQRSGNALPRARTMLEPSSTSAQRTARIAEGGARRSVRASQPLGEGLHNTLSNATITSSEGSGANLLGLLELTRTSMRDTEAQLGRWQRPPAASSSHARQVDGVRDSDSDNSLTWNSLQCLRRVASASGWSAAPGGSHLQCGLLSAGPVGCAAKSSPENLLHLSGQLPAFPGSGSRYRNRASVMQLGAEHYGSKAGSSQSRLTASEEEGLRVECGSESGGDVGLVRYLHSNAVQAGRVPVSIP